VSTRGGLLLDVALSLAAAALAAAAVARLAAAVPAARAAVVLAAPVVEAGEALASLPLCGGGDPLCAPWRSRWQGPVHRRAVFYPLRARGHLVRVETVACRKRADYRVTFAVMRPGVVPRQVPWMRVDRYAGGVLQSPVPFSVHWRGAPAGSGTEQSATPLSGVLDGPGALHLDYSRPLPRGRWYRFEVRWGVDEPVAWVCEVPW